MGGSSHLHSHWLPLQQASLTPGTMALHLALPLIPLGMGAARIWRNLTPDERDQTPQSTEAKHAAAATLAGRTLTKERLGSWSEEKLEKMIVRNSVCKSNEAHLREQHALAMAARAETVVGA